MYYHDHGILHGKTTVDNGTDLQEADKGDFALQSELVDRYARDQKFREAVRLAARADGVIQGGETVIEQLHRHACDTDLTSRGIVAGHNLASRIMRVPMASIGVKQC